MLAETRSGPVESLKNRLRCGLLSVDSVKLAAGLGSKIALALFPSEQPVDWARRETRVKLIERMEKPLCVRFAVACVEVLLPSFEATYPAEKRPRQALEAAKEWLLDPSEDNESRARKSSTGWATGWAAENLDRNGMIADAADCLAWAASSGPYWLPTPISLIASYHGSYDWQKDLLARLILDTPA